MIRIVAAVFDSKAKLFGEQLMVFVAPGVAVRSFTEAVNSEKSDIGRYPEDFALYKMGEYDDVTGVVSPCVPQPELIVSALNVLRPKDSKQLELVKEA